MSSRSLLKSIISFADVPAGESASLPHGLNIMGAGIVPDTLVCSESQSKFDVTADDTDITLTNKSGVAASVDILAEHWHSIPRQLRQDDLPIQPFKGGGQGVGAPAPAYVWRPGAPAEKALGDNVYTDWEELYEALQSTKNDGPRDLWFDSTYSPVSIPGGASISGPTCEIPAGTWDMTDVRWMSREKGGPDLPQVNISFAEGAFCPNLETIETNANIWSAGLHSPLSKAFTCGEVGRTIWCLDSGEPIVKLAEDGTFNPTFQLNSGCQFQAGSSGIPFSTPSVSPAPIIDIADEFVFAQGFGCLMPDNVFMTSGTGFMGFVGSGAAYSGRHDWAMPGLVNGYFANLLTAGGYYPQTIDGIDDGADVWLSRRYLTDTSGGPISVQALDSFCHGQFFSLSDKTGDCGINPVSVLDTPLGGTVQAPYLTRPFQTKTWMSDDAGNWICVYDSYEPFQTPVQVAAFSVVNNSTNVADPETAAADIVALMPLAATARKGATVRFKNISQAGAFLLKATPDGADTIDEVAAAFDIGNGGYVTYESDGVSNWMRVA